MQATAIRGYLAYQHGRDAVVRNVQDRVTDERGEIGSWLILAAGLAIAAGAAVALLGPWLGTKVTDITSN